MRIFNRMNFTSGGRNRTADPVRLALIALSMLLVPSASAQNDVLPLGSALPMATASVTLSDGSQTTLNSLAGSTATVVVFWSNKCPWCSKMESRMSDFLSGLDRAAVSVILVNSNDPAAFPAESASENNAIASRFKVPYIGDESAALMKAFGASRAPHFYVFDKDKTLVYYGSFDDSPGDESNVQIKYVADAVSAVQAGKAVAVSDTKAFGCLIKQRQ